jgi:hypothetical protein
VFCLTPFCLMFYMRHHSEIGNECNDGVVVIIRAVVRSDAFYRTTVRRFRVLRMWDIVLIRSSSRHHLLKCLVHLVKWGELLVHQNTTKRPQDGHCPGTIVVNLCFARGVWWGSVLRHHSFSAHVRRVRTRETWGGWIWGLPVREPPVCFLFLLLPNISLILVSAVCCCPPLRYDERAYPGMLSATSTNYPSNRTVGVKGNHTFSTECHQSKHAPLLLSVSKQDSKIYYYNWTNMTTTTTNRNYNMNNINWNFHQG